jgi:23S rRNA pseudouridine1911/1915/1917 synthase
MTDGETVNRDDDNHTETSEPAFMTVKVSEEHAGKRLDRFLVDAVPDLSRSRVKAMIDDGQVKVNRRRARKGDTVAEGNEVEILAPPPPRDFSPIAKDDPSVAVRHEDADVIVIEKPAGLPTHPLRPDEVGTAANVVIARWPETHEVGFSRKEPGLLHRLDTDTSGLLVVCRNAEAFESLRRASREGRVTKRYLALVEGKIAADGRVDYPLVPHRKDPKRVEAVTPHVRLRAGTKTHEAHTRYRPMRTLVTPPAASGGLQGEYTLIEVELETAFRHQVRVHLSTVGHPLVGDVLYRGPDVSSELGLHRHFLHATEVMFPAPKDGQIVRVTSPLPKELSNVLDRLRS